ncbi:MAG TPA: serine/threonine-protein kinase, partial [Myxococcales bacterium]|nr:serine/threonine-protein kinase [Myxococcales bacterium]
MADGSALVLGGRFEVGERIASGGMASVYHGTCVTPDDRLADRPLAIKILHDHLTENPSFVRMFRDEGSIAARFEHAHIVRVHDVAHDQGKHFIVM